MTKPTTPPPDQPAKNESNGLAIASLVLGILTFSGFLFLTGIPAIITGLMSLKAGQKERGMSIAGILMGAVGTLLSLALAALVIFLIFFVMANAPSGPHSPMPGTDSPMPIESSQT